MYSLVHLATTNGKEQAEELLTTFFPRTHRRGRGRSLSVGCYHVRHYDGRSRAMAVGDQIVESTRFTSNGLEADLASRQAHGFCEFPRITRGRSTPRSVEACQDYPAQIAGQRRLHHRRRLVAHLAPRYTRHLSCTSLLLRPFTLREPSCALTENTIYCFYGLSGRVFIRGCCANLVLRR